MRWPVMLAPERGERDGHHPVGVRMTIRSIGSAGSAWNSRRSRYTAMGMLPSVITRTNQIHRAPGRRSLCAIQSQMVRKPR